MIIVTNKSKNFDYRDCVDIFISKYERSTYHTITETMTYLSLLVTFLLTFLVAYISWNLESFKTSFSAIWNAPWMIKFIIFCVLFTTFVLAFKSTSWVLKKFEDKIMKFMRINEYDEQMRKLNKLYLAKLEPSLWELKIEVDRNVGLFALSEVSYQKKGTE